PRDDVLALGVRQELPVQLLLSRRRMPGERDARAGVGSHVPEDHRLHVRSGPEVVGDLVEVPVIHRALPVPGTEDRGDRLLQLLAAILRKGLTDLGLVEFLELCHDGLQIVEESSVSFAAWDASLRRSRSASNLRPSTSLTIRPNIAMSRR